MRIGDVVRRLREQRGLNQRELADRAGVQQSYLSRVEGAAGGRVRVDVLALDRIARALEVTVDEILLMAGVRPSKDRKADLRWKQMERIFRDLATARQEEILAIADTLRSMSEKRPLRTRATNARLAEDIEEYDKDNEQCRSQAGL